MESSGPHQARLGTPITEHNVPRILVQELFCRPRQQAYWPAVWDSLALLVPLRDESAGPGLVTYPVRHLKLITSVLYTKHILFNYDLVAPN